MAKYLIIDLKTKQTLTVCSLAEAAAIVELDDGDIEWALEEEGVCETDRHVVSEVDPK